MDSNKDQRPPSNLPHPAASPVRTQPRQNSFKPGPGESGYVPPSVGEHHDLMRNGAPLNPTPSAQPSGIPVINVPDPPGHDFGGLEFGGGPTKHQTVAEHNAGVVETPPTPPPSE